jgi:hypothetical protein
MRAIPFLFAILTGCMVGTAGPGSGGGAPDAGNGTSNGGNGSNNGSSSGVLPDAATGGGADAGNGCINAVAQVGDGHHNPGQDCMNACHNHGFTVAGTLYSAINSSTPVIGATIRVVDANNKITDIVTQQNGNFYASTAVTAPLTVLATSCPDINHMSATVATSGGIIGCNKSGCHVAGNRIHLP